METNEMRLFVYTVICAAIRKQQTYSLSHTHSSQFKIQEVHHRQRSENKYCINPSAWISLDKRMCAISAHSDVLQETCAPSTTITLDKARNS